MGDLNVICKVCRGTLDWNEETVAGITSALIYPCEECGQKDFDKGKEEGRDEGLVDGIDIGYDQALEEMRDDKSKHEI